MDSKVSLLMDRASNEIFAAQSLKKISESSSLKKEFELSSETSFYSIVIGDYVNVTQISNVLP